MKFDFGFRTTPQCSTLFPVVANGRADGQRGLLIIKIQLATCLNCQEHIMWVAEKLWELLFWYGMAPTSVYLVRGLAQLSILLKELELELE
jgi:hypothetical protein